MTVADLWTECYQGEVLGEAFFATLAEGEADAERRQQLEALTRLERATRELAEPVFERNGYDRGDSEAGAEAARNSARAASAMGWADLLHSVCTVAETYLVKYRELVDLVDNDEDRVVAEAYVDHELALVAFARRALGEEAGDPLELIFALPHVAGAPR